jgi:hypothetical protein
VVPLVGRLDYLRSFGEAISVLRPADRGLILGAPVRLSAATAATATPTNAAMMVDASGDIDKADIACPQLAAAFIENEWNPAEAFGHYGT